MKVNVYYILLFMILNSNLISETIQYQYDNLNRLTQVDYGNGTIFSYAYDDLGNRLSLIIQNSEIQPDTPTNLTIVIDNEQLVISWDNVDGANSYKIYGSINVDGPYNNISDIGIFNEYLRKADQKQKASSPKQFKKISEKNQNLRNRQTWSCSLSEINERFFYVIASTDDRDIEVISPKKNNKPKLIRKVSDN